LVNKRQNISRKIFPYNYYLVKLFEDNISLLPKTIINKYDSAVGIKLKLRYYENDTFYFTQKIALPYKSIFSIQKNNLNVKILTGTLSINLMCIGLFNYYTQRGYVDLRPILWGNVLLGIPAAIQSLFIPISKEVTYLREWKIEEYSFKEAKSPNVPPKNIFEKKGIKF
jgi:hypothetical protein